jgi:hypothetical protein
MVVGKIALGPKGRISRLKSLNGGLKHPASARGNRATQIICLKQILRGIATPRYYVYYQSTYTTMG